MPSGTCCQWPDTLDHQYILNMKQLVFPIFLALMMAACDTVKEPIPPGTGGQNGGGGNEGTVRRVLLEDFTGHRCNNCPAATSTAIQLQELYGDRVIVVGVHATQTFAAPLPNSPDGSYTTDFRTDAGTAYEQAFGVSFLPVGMVNRKHFNNVRLLSPNQWSTRVGEMIDLPAAFDIWFEELAYDPNTRTIDTEIKVAVLEPVSGDHALTIYLTEDHVIDWQYNAQADPPNVPNYEHRHVLRDNVNGTWGAPLISGSADVGDTLTLSYSGYTLAPNWNEANCSLVAYLYRTDNEEVMQAQEQKIQ